jgi:hypothetical protein
MRAAAGSAERRRRCVLEREQETRSGEQRRGARRGDGLEARRILRGVRRVLAGRQRWRGGHGAGVETAAAGMTVIGPGTCADMRVVVQIGAACGGIAVRVAGARGGFTMHGRVVMPARVLAILAHRAVTLCRSGRFPVAAERIVVRARTDTPRTAREREVYDGQEGRRRTGQQGTRHVSHPENYRDHSFEQSTGGRRRVPRDDAALTDVIRDFIAAGRPLSNAGIAAPVPHPTSPTRQRPMCRGLYPVYGKGPGCRPRW